MKFIKIFLLVLILFPSFYLISCGHVTLGLDWRTANRESAGIAPDPTKVREALVQVYSARAFSWRGLFGVHTWIALKKENSDHYLVLQVVGWNKWRGLSVVIIKPDSPDRRWYAAEPTVIGQLCGEQANVAIPKILSAAQAYPHANEYHIWPGPNSNTFTAHLIHEVSELDVDLPATAIGKEYIPGGNILSYSKGGEAFRFSLKGLLGFGLGKKSGLDIHVLGASFGISLDPISLKLPVFGRIGATQTWCQPH